MKAMRSLREREIAKHQFLVEQARDRYGFTDADIKSGLDRIDKGELDDREMAEQLPFRVDGVEKLIAMNDEIKKQRTLLAELEGDGEVSS